MATGTLNFERWTLDLGELNAGIWGEGYVDRRHPHTFVHELVATLQGRMLGLDLSVTGGKGFAPFGTDDPMVRPFVKYPANHHLAQILERGVLIAAVRRGALLLEGGIFNGDERLGAGSPGRGAGHARHTGNGRGEHPGVVPDAAGDHGARGTLGWSANGDRDAELRALDAGSG